MASNEGPKDVDHRSPSRSKTPANINSLSPLPEDQMPDHNSSESDGLSSLDDTDTEMSTESGRLNAIERKIREVISLRPMKTVDNLDLVKAGGKRAAVEDPDGLRCGKKAKCTPESITERAGGVDDHSVNVEEANGDAAAVGDEAETDATQNRVQKDGGLKKDGGSEAIVGLEKDAAQASAAVVPSEQNTVKSVSLGNLDLSSAGSVSRASSSGTEQVSGIVTATGTDGVRSPDDSLRRSQSSSADVSADYIAQHNQKISKLEAQVAGLRSSGEALQSSNFAMTAYVSGLEARLHAESLERERLRDWHYDLALRNAALQAIVHIHQDISKAQHKASLAKSDLATKDHLEKQIQKHDAVWESKLDNLRRGAKAKIHKLEKETEEKTTKYTEERAEFKKQIVQLKLDVKSANSAYKKQLRGEQQEAIAKHKPATAKAVKDCEAVIKQKNTDITTLQTSLQTTQDEVARLKTAMSSLQGTLEAKIEMIKEGVEMRFEQQAQMIAKDKRIHQLATELETVKGKLQKQVETTEYYGRLADEQRRAAFAARGVVERQVGRIAELEGEKGKFRENGGGKGDGHGNTEA